MLDMRSVDGIELADDGASAGVGGGVLIGDLLDFLHKKGETTPGAYADSVGYVAWACGGGYGVLCGAYGLGVDQILGGRLVLASGEVVDTDKDGDRGKEVLWALRGGGAGVFGVVTQLRVRVYPLTRCLGGNVMFPLRETPEVFEGLERMYENEGKPDRFANETMIRNPPGSGGVLSFVFFWVLKEDASDLEEAKEFLDRVTKLGTLVSNTVEESESCTATR